MVAGCKTGFHLQFSPKTAGVGLLPSQVEPARHGFFLGLLDVAVAQPLPLPGLPAAVTVLPGLPVGEDEFRATQTQGLILQGLLAQTSVGDVQGAGILEVNLILHHLDAVRVLAVVEARLGGRRVSDENAGPGYDLYVGNSRDFVGPAGLVLQEEEVPLCPRRVAGQKDVVVREEGFLALVLVGTAEGHVEVQRRDGETEKQPWGGEHDGLGLGPAGRALPWPLLSHP